jgi:hypothetical protein
MTTQFMRSSPPANGASNLARTCPQSLAEVAGQNEARRDFTKVLGFKPDGDWFTAPGGSTPIRLTKATGSAGLAIPFPSPGRESVRLLAHNIAGLAGQLTAAGRTVVTTGESAGPTSIQWSASDDPSRAKQLRIATHRSEMMRAVYYGWDCQERL